MTIRKSSKNVLMFLLVASALALPIFKASAAALTWTSLSGVTNLWSDTNNWSPVQSVVPGDSLVFTNAASTNLLGAVNNTLDTDYTLTKLTFSAFGNGTNAEGTTFGPTNFHTTLIPEGVTLTVNSSNSTFFYVGSGANNGNLASNYTTITGKGRLVLGNPASPSTNINSNLQIKQGHPIAANHRAVLDMSGLDTFIFAAGKFAVAGDGTAAVDRILGSVLLAKTNVITCAAPRYTDPSLIVSQPFTIGSSPNSQSANNLTNVVLLGQENTINADYFKIGGLKLIGQMSFRPGLTNPTVKLRGKDGVSRVPMIVLGDHAEARVVSFVARGNLDLSLGTVDALVDEMYLGKNGWRDNATDTGSASGLMTLAAGTFDVTTLNIGCQQGDNLGIATGTVHVRTNALLVAGNINIGRDSGAATGNGFGYLIIGGGSATVSGNLLENSGPGGNGGSVLVITNNGSLNMMPSGDTVPGNITVDRLNFGVGTLTNYGTLSLSNLNVLAPATEFVIYPGQTLAPFVPGVVGTMLVNGNLTLSNALLRFDLNAPGLNDQINVTGALSLGGVNTMNVSAVGGAIAPGIYTVMTYGTLIGDTNNLQVTGALANSRYSFEFDTNTVPNVNLTVSGGPSISLIWSGDGVGNVWDSHTTTNWNLHTEKFFALDTVSFDDTGSANPAVNLVGTLEPAGNVTVSSANNYTFSGSGKISGSSGLTKNGSGTLTIATANDYVGDTVLNDGKLLVSGVLGNTTVNVFGGTLGGTGTILGPVNVFSPGTFSPGASIGTLAISNNLVLNDSVTTVFEANLDTQTNDQVVGLKTVAYGGTLSLVLSGRPVTASDTFKLFSATTAATALSSPYDPGNVNPLIPLHTFSSIVPATPGPANLLWNTSTLTTDGTLRVVSTTPTSMSVVVTGDQFDISWPADHIGWKLQRQINPLTVGLSNNWTDVAGSTTTNHVIVTINQANETVFYRLVSPDLP